MAEYEITIVRRVPNPEYQSCQPFGYRESRQEQQQYTEFRTLNAALTEAEYEAVKQALIAHWAKS